MRMISNFRIAKSKRNERGAALITMLLVSVPLLMAGGALIMVTSMSAANSSDSAAETKAYYAAEAGTQSVLNVLRGNVAPNPTFASDPAGSVAPENMINFRKAVTASTSNVSGDNGAPRLSRWLSYDSTYTDRVILNSNYSPINGMAFNASLSDPDNSAAVTFSTSGGFTNYNMDTSHQFGNGNTKMTITYQAQPATTITTSGASTLGSFVISNVGNNGNTLANEPFSLTINQTAPWPITFTINCTLTGTITSTTSFVVVNFPTTSNNLLGPLYDRGATSVNSNGSTPIAVTVTAPQPNRLTASVTGFGPRAARKQMQMLISRFSFDYAPASLVTLRSADDGSLTTFAAGNSAQYFYSGFDKAAGQNLSAFGVTSATDYNYLTSLGLPGSQVSGTPGQIQQVSVSSLPFWLQNADGARLLVNELRVVSQSENRYFTPATPPSDFGTLSQPQFTFIDGDGALPPAGGAGLLIVTGTLSLDGSSTFNGLILVLGQGQLIRSGGGNGNTFGSILVARFGNNGDFLAPTFNSNGSGTSSLQYDSDWVRRALSTPGPRVMAVGEF
jgi:Flp pilus assembly protein TadG